MKVGDVWRRHQAVIDERPPRIESTYRKRCDGSLIAERPSGRLRLVVCDECGADYAIPAEAQPPAHDAEALPV